jgi:hypothetical protein
MGEYTERVAAQVVGLLEPGEPVLAATSCAPRGAMRGIARGDGRRQTARGRAEAAAFGVEPAPQYVLALTDRRLVWFGTSLLGRPKAVAGAVPRGEVTSVELGTGRALGQHYTEVRLVARNGRRCTFEVARLHAGDAEALVASFVGAGWPDAAAG